MFITDSSEDEKIHPTPQNTPAKKKKNNQKKPAPPGQPYWNARPTPNLRIVWFFGIPFICVVTAGGRRNTIKPGPITTNLENS